MISRLKMGFYDGDTSNYGIVKEFTTDIDLNKLFNSKDIENGLIESGVPKEEKMLTRLDIAAKRKGVVVLSYEIISETGQKLASVDAGKIKIYDDNGIKSILIGRNYGGFQTFQDYLLIQNYNILEKLKYFNENILPNISNLGSVETIVNDLFKDSVDSTAANQIISDTLSTCKSSGDNIDSELQEVVNNVGAMTNSTDVNTFLTIVPTIDLNSSSTLTTLGIDDFTSSSIENYSSRLKEIGKFDETNFRDSSNNPFFENPPAASTGYEETAFSTLVDEIAVRNSSEQDYPIKPQEGIKYILPDTVNSVWINNESYDGDLTDARSIIDTTVAIHQWSKMDIEFIYDDISNVDFDNTTSIKWKKGVIDGADVDIQNEGAARDPFGPLFSRIVGKVDSNGKNIFGFSTTAGEYANTGYKIIMHEYVDSNNDTQTRKPCLMVRFKCYNLDPNNNADIINQTIWSEWAIVL